MNYVYALKDSGGRFYDAVVSNVTPTAPVPADRICIAGKTSESDAIAYRDYLRVSGIRSDGTIVAQAE